MHNAHMSMSCVGKDADEMYEDIGHSNEARKTMKKYLIGNLEVGIKFPTALKSNGKSLSNDGVHIEIQ